MKLRKIKICKKFNFTLKNQYQYSTSRSEASENVCFHFMIGFPWSLYLHTIFLWCGQELTLNTAMCKTRNTGTWNGMRRTRGTGGKLYSGECRQTFRGMSPNIPGNVGKHSGECRQTFRAMSPNIRGMSPNILGNVAKYSGEFRQKFQGMSPNIPGNIIKDSAECPERVGFQIQR